MAHVLETKLKLDTTDFVRKSKQATTEAKKVGAAGDKAGTTTAQGMNKASAGMSNFARSAESAAGAMIARFVGVGAVVAGVQRAIAAAVADAQRLDKQLQTHIGGLRKDAAAAGDTAHFSRIKQELGEMGKSGVHADKARALYRGVRGALPDENIDTVMGLVRAGEPGVKAGYDAESYAMLIGEMHTSINGLSPKDAAARAAAIVENSGDAYKRLRRGGLRGMRGLMAAGIGEDEAQEMFTGALKSEGTAAPAEMLADQLAMVKSESEIRGVKSKEEKAYWRASPTERLQMIRGDSKLAMRVLGTQGLDVIRMLKEADKFKGKSSADPGEALRNLQKDPDAKRDIELEEAEAKAVASENTSEAGRRSQRVSNVMKKGRETTGSGLVSGLLEWPMRAQAAIADPILEAIGLPSNTDMWESLSGAGKPNVTINAPGVQFNSPPSRTANTTTTRPVGGGGW